MILSQSYPQTLIGLFFVHCSIVLLFLTHSLLPANQEAEGFSQAELNQPTIHHVCGQLREVETLLDNDKSSHGMGCCDP